MGSASAAATSGLQQSNGPITVGGSDSTSSYVPWIILGILGLVGLVVFFKLKRK